MHHATITIIGAGNMGAGLISGLIANHYPPEKIWAVDPATEKLQELKEKLHIHTTQDAKAAIPEADIVVLAIKPQLFKQVMQDIAAPLKQRNPLVISVAAGIRIDSIQKYIGSQGAIVRAMPNTPALIGCGATALFANAHVSEDQRDLAESILRAISLIVWVTDEKQMDTVTALSGSGPAYFFLMMEALQDAACELGLPTETARLLTTQTALGAARMALESDIDVVELRRRVTSPGGTTEQAVIVLEKHHIRDIFKKAIIAAKNRSEELAQLLEKAE